MMTKEGSTKLVNFVLATVGPILWCGHIGEIVKMFNFIKNLQIYSLAWVLLSKEFDDDHRLWSRIKEGGVVMAGEREREYVRLYDLKIQGYLDKHSDWVKM